MVLVLLAGLQVIDSLHIRLGAVFCAAPSGFPLDLIAGFRLDRVEDVYHELVLRVMVMRIFGMTSMGVFVKTIIIGLQGIEGVQVREALLRLASNLELLLDAVRVLHVLGRLDLLHDAVGAEGRARCKELLQRRESLARLKELMYRRRARGAVEEVGCPFSLSGVGVPAVPRRLRRAWVHLLPLRGIRPPTFAILSAFATALAVLALLAALAVLAAFREDWWASLPDASLTYWTVTTEMSFLAALIARLSTRTAGLGSRGALRVHLHGASFAGSLGPAFTLVAELVPHERIDLLPEVLLPVRIVVGARGSSFVRMFVTVMISIAAYGFHALQSASLFAPATLIIKVQVNSTFIIIIRHDAAIAVLLGEVALDRLRAHVFKTHDLIIIIIIIHKIMRLDSSVFGQPLLPRADCLDQTSHRRLLGVIQRSTLVPHGPVS